MNRRNVLALVGAGVSVSGGYFAWNRYHSLSLPDGMDVETLYVDRNVFGESGRNVDSRKAHHRIIGDEKTVADEITVGDSAIEFAEETDFDNSSLIIVQTRMQSEPDLGLEAISRTDDGLHLDVAVDHPWGQGVNDDSSPHSLLIRVTDEKDDIPETVSVDIEGYV